MLSAVAAFVLAQDNTAIEAGGGSTTVASAKGSNPATDTYPGSAPDAYVLTDAGIDTTCTDIDFEDADVTVSNLGGDAMCCNWKGGSKSSQTLLCPTVNAANNGFDIVEIPNTVENARQILDVDYMMYSVCHGSPDAELQGTIAPHEGSTSYFKLSGVETDPLAPPINLIVKNTSEYIPAWPILGTCAGSCSKGSDFKRNHAAGTVLKPAGYLNNGRKTGAIVAKDLLQINLCNQRFLNLRSSFVDNDDKDVTLMQSTMRFFDIDHGAADKQGPEVMQFDCTGGTFTLYGVERDEDADVADLEFLMHISDDAKAGHRPDDYGKTPNGLDIHVYDCPANKFVTLWSSRFGKGKDNPTSSVIEANSEYGKLQEQSMVQIDMYNINHFDVSFGVMDQDYQDGYEIMKKVNKKKVGTGTYGKADPVKLKRLQDGLELTYANYPEQERGQCPYDTSGRNWLFAGMKGVSEKSCPPPAPPPASPPPGCDDSTCANGEYASANVPDSVSGDATCMPCDSACDTCAGPGADDCTICPMSCPQPGSAGICANGQYTLDGDCLDCDSSCVTGTVGPLGGAAGDSCTGPDASQCTKCPYECDPSCDGESSPSYADWTSGSLVCQACDASCTSCTGPDASECTTCNPDCDVSQCAHGTYPHGDECRDCDASNEFCTGPGAGKGEGAGVDCPKACEISQCANGEYAVGIACESCDAACVGVNGGIGESCRGPEAGDCQKCPYECDESCAGESDPSYADWTSGSLVCQACDASCTGTGDGTGAGCTGPDADECTTCLEPPPPASPPPPAPSSPPPPFPSPPPPPAPTSCGDGTCSKGEYDSDGTSEGCTACDACCASCSGPGPSDCTSCEVASDCDSTCPSSCKEEGSGCGIADECKGCAIGVTNVKAAAAQACVIAGNPAAPPSPPSIPLPGAQIFDDPHVRTLSGNQFFMHGVGVFDYASIPNVITTQVYMCPFAPCTADMMEMGECLTFIQAVAVKLEKGHPNSEHIIVWRNNALRIDQTDRKAEANITLGSQTSIRASGRGKATAHPDRVQHQSLADCHVLSTKGQRDVMDESTPAKEGKRLLNTGAGADAPATPLASEPYPREGLVNQRADVDVPMQKGTAGWSWADKGIPLSKGERQANQQAGAKVPEGGVWAECTNNEWTLSTPQMTIDVGVIGPFEEGYLREKVSDRTFNLNVLNVADKDALQGIINGDKNGLFKVMEDLNPATGGPVDENVGALVPKGPHGAVQEVTAANVVPGKVLFPYASMKEMDAACGEQQSLRAIRTLTKNGDGDLSADGQRMWKDFKSRTRLNGPH